MQFCFKVSVGKNDDVLKCTYTSANANANACARCICSDQNEVLEGCMSALRMSAWSRVMTRLWPKSFSPSPAHKAHGVYRLSDIAATDEDLAHAIQRTGKRYGYPDVDNC